MFKKIGNVIKSIGKGLLKVIPWVKKEINLNNELKPGADTIAETAFLLTTRTETDGQLEIFEGTMPPDLHGVFYVAYPAGSVNSGGLPFPEQLDGSYNKEYASPIMNGDGMLVSIGFNGTKNPSIKSRLMKTPCYFADYNSREENGHDKIFGFSNFGISRLSLVMGARNQLNTAAIPVKFADANPFLLSTYDVGRPFITDPVSMKLKTPVGQNTDWVPGTPPEVPWAFHLVQTTAHPSFDPNTKELFTVNYTKSSKGQAYVHTPRTVYHLKNNPDILQAKLKGIAVEMAGETDSNKVKDRLEDFFNNLDHYVGGDERNTADTEHPVETSVWLMRWKGTELIEKWSLTDQSGNLLQITECMHQTALTKDFIVLTDCSFKFSMDLLVNNPFPEDPLIDAFIRRHLDGTMLPQTDCYIVKRADLIVGGGSAVALKLQQPIPVETIHYSCDYDNPDEKITLYGIHNTAACVAEWIRSYDVSQLTGAPVSKEMISLFALGSMDVNRIGKWVIDVKTMQIDNDLSKQYYATGKTDQADIGPNTWTLGLYTFRDMISPTKTVSQIKSLWYVANGLDSRMLTQFVYSLYTNYVNRIVPVDEVVNLTKQDLPQTLVALNCATMQPFDHFQFDKNIYIRSLHFIPRPAPSPNVSYELDGHFFCTVQAGMPQINPSSYRSEYWVFDAAKISAGPVCKFKFDDIQFCFTLHTAWLESALPFNLPYDVDIKTDYDTVINKLIDDPIVKKFFDDYVYSNWYAYKNTP